MPIPLIWTVIVGVKSWVRRIALKRELAEHLHHLLVSDVMGQYEEGSDFDSVYADIEREYISHGFSKEEIKKVCDSISTVVISG